MRADVGAVGAASGDAVGDRTAVSGGEAGAGTTATLQTSFDQASPAAFASLSPTVAAVADTDLMPCPHC